MYINHINLLTGQLTRTSRDHSDDEMINALKPWLNKALEEKIQFSIPILDLSYFGASAYIQDGGLVVAVFAQNAKNKQDSKPFMTFAIASRSRHSRPLWASLLANLEHKEDIEMPSTPWVATFLDSTIITSKNIKELSDFERCVAWAWIEK